jgi:hypothetical protein
MWPDYYFTRFVQVYPPLIIDQRFRPFAPTHTHNTHHACTQTHTHAFTNTHPRIHKYTPTHSHKSTIRSNSRRKLALFRSHRERSTAVPFVPVHIVLPRCWFSFPLKLFV